MLVFGRPHRATGSQWRRPGNDPDHQKHWQHGRAGYGAIPARCQIDPRKLVAGKLPTFFSSDPIGIAVTCAIGDRGGGQPPTALRCLSWGWSGV